MKSQKFNLVEHRVIKKSLNDYGNCLIEREMSFYKEFKIPYFPIIYSMFENGYEMEYIDGVPLWKVEWTPSIEEKLFKVVSEIHSYKTIRVEREYFIEQILLETIHKIKKRDLQTYSVPYFKTVNGIHVEDLDTVTDKIEKYFTTHHRDVWEFNSIHGDLNFGNIIYNGNIRFIDPRGYFGNSINIGPKEYDFAKIYFSLSGYDYLYNNDVEYTSDSENITYDLRPTHLCNCSLFVKYMMISIWLSSSVFFNDNLNKRTISRYHGLYLASKLI